jgi:hypothetical protein
MQLLTTYFCKVVMNICNRNPPTKTINNKQAHGGNEDNHRHEQGYRHVHSE